MNTPTKTKHCLTCLRERDVRMPLRPDGTCAHCDHDDPLCRIGCIGAYPHKGRRWVCRCRCHKPPPTLKATP